MQLFFRSLVWLTGVCVLAMAAAVQAGDAVAVLVTGPAGQISAQELEAEAERRVPEKDKALFWGTPQIMADYALELYAYRALARQAREAGFEPPPRVPEPASPEAAGDRIRAAIEQERQVGFAWLQDKARQAIPDEDAAQAWARSEYRANPERFVVPAQAHVRHILLRVRPGDSAEQKEEVRQRAASLLEKLQQGADFAALARQHSEDQGSARRGGDLGMAPRQRWVKPFSDAAFELQEPGQLTGPVETEFGWHVIELVEAQPERQAPFEEVLPQLRQQLELALVQREQQEIWSELQDAATVDDAAIRALAARQLNRLK